MATPNVLNPWNNPYVDQAMRNAITPIAKDVYNNPGNVAKGALSAPFTAAPDLLGLIPGVNISGDPIREAIGLNPSSPAGILGEFMDPTSTALKGAKWLGKGLLALPLIPPVALAKRGFDSEPLFHGTHRAFDTFERGKRGSATGARSARRGVWLTDDPDLAGAYADLSRSEELGKGWDEVMQMERDGRYEAAAELTRKLEQMDTPEHFPSGQNIRPSRIRGKYMEVDMEGADYSASGTSDRIHDIISEAESKGFDGVRFKNLSDDPRPFTNKPTTHVVVFDEKNIAGEFDFLSEGDEALQRAELPKPADPGSVEETKLTKQQVEQFRQRISDYNKPKASNPRNLWSGVMDPNEPLRKMPTEFVGKPIGVHASNSKLDALKGDRPFYVSAEASDDYVREFNYSVVPKTDDVTMAHAMDEDVRMAFYDEVPLETLRNRYMADIVVGDDGTRLILNPDKFKLVKR